jgi:hypothetical protein
MSNSIWLHCRYTTGSELGEPSRDHFYTVETAFDLRHGVSYPSLALGLFATTLLTLVRDETGLPNWLPAGLFEMDFSSLPRSWEFTVYDGRAASGGDAADRWVAIWGYSRLVRDQDHRDALLERDPEALRVFAALLEDTL